MLGTTNCHVVLNTPRSFWLFCCGCVRFCVLLRFYVSVMEDVPVDDVVEEHTAAEALMSVVIASDRQHPKFPMEPTSPLSSLGRPCASLAANPPSSGRRQRSPAGPTFPLSCVSSVLGHQLRMGYGEPGMLSVLRGDQGRDRG